MEQTKKKAFRVPHQLIIMITIAAIATLATYIVPAGAYEQIEINGRKAIDAASFHYIEQTPVGLWDAFLALPGGFSKQVSIIAMITMIAGAMGVINETKCFDASVGKLAAKYKDNLYLIIPLLLAPGGLRYSGGHGDQHPHHRLCSPGTYPGIQSGR